MIYLTLGSSHRHGDSDCTAHNFEKDELIGIGAYLLGGVKTIQSDQYPPVRKASVIPILRYYRII